MQEMQEEEGKLLSAANIEVVDTKHA